MDDMAAVRHSRLVSISQMMQPTVLLGVVIAVIIGVVFAGVALLRGQLSDQAYLAIMTGLLGLLGGGAIGAASQSRAPQRATDMTPPTSSTVTVTGDPPSATVRTQ